MTSYAPSRVSFVSLDLEMTGIDPQTDDIIEVGAILFTPDGVVDRLQTFVNPGRPVPYRIRTLTGIGDEELEAAPPFEMVAERLRDFIGVHPVIGQHVAFDLMYLARNGLQPPGPVYNTAEIAELLIPGEAEYSLRSLATRFGVPFPVQHRAMPDAEAALAVFLRLRERAASLDPLLLLEINHLTAGTSWPLRYFFRDLTPVSLASAGEAPGLAPMIDLVPAGKAGSGALTANAERRMVDLAEIGDVFVRVAEHPEAYSGFEQRPQQVEMARAVAAALDEDGNLLVEAGTGTGKSLAYLLPAAFHALRNNDRVVISTSTIGLQEQILDKDIPALRRLLAVCGPQDVRDHLGELTAVPLKGRGNYVCLQKLATLRRQAGLTTDEARFAVKVLLWLQQSESGDRAELNIKPDEEQYWSRVSAANANCFAGGSYFVRNGSCQLLRARKRAESAHLVVVNHALLLSDIANGGRVLPGYERLIVDEAHNFEDEATSQFGFHTGQTELRATLAALLDRAADRETGLVPDVRTALRGEGDARQQQDFIRTLLVTVTELIARARERLPEMFAGLQGFITAHGSEPGEYDNRLLITAGKRSQPEWQNVELAWENLRVALVAVQDGLSRLNTAVVDLGATGILDWEGLAAQIGAQQQGLLQLITGMDSVLLRHDAERIAWLTVHRQFGTVSIASAPLNVGEVLDSYLFGRKSSVILTSATLSTGGNFRYVRDRLGLDGVEELAVGSPFDYKHAALVLVPADMPEPNRLDYQRALEDAVISLVRASEGRALVLFTSHAALRSTHRNVARVLEADGIRVLGQGIDGTPAELLAALRGNFRTVLLGTSSFWEGVDVAGEALSLLVIAKLPFSVPSDPVFAARSELFDDSFTQFALPQAVLRFKQGFGRLIRHRADRGVLVVLDRRVRSKRYGRTFLQSLPDCSISEAPMAQLPALARRWLQAAKG